ncbi:MAG: hypothetical protein OEM64_12050 [Gammaproteobacteria bacterium]|nr:hypothetical protein [Gammaproteobacteria bacterium]MDH3417033.1 hypothetical protein [Gammaproteobacteria bacterium]
MDLKLLTLLLVLLVSIWVLIRIRKSSGTEQTKTTVKAHQGNAAYHAVSIKLSGHACKAAEDMMGRRFLSTAAPKLPLPGCDVLDCNCRFIHHKDRRAGKDRRSPFAPSGFAGGTGRFEAEQRKGEDRRASDDEDFY